LQTGGAIARVNGTSVVPHTTREPSIAGAILATSGPGARPRQRPARTAHRSFADDARRFARVSSIVERMTSLATAE
jgi:hypothetical protein